MSLISQTTSYTTPGIYTYIIPQGVGSLEFHIWGAGGAAGAQGPKVQLQSGTSTTRVETGTSQVQTGTQQISTGTIQVQTGTTQVQTGTKQVQTGTIRVQTGTTQEAYLESRTVNDNKYGGSSSTKGLGYSGGLILRYRTVPVYENQPVFSTVPVYETQPVYSSQEVYTTQPIYTTQVEYSDLVTPVYTPANGGAGGQGAGGGYASRKIQVQAGDVIVISVGSAGVGSAGGQSSASSSFNGGSAGVSSNGGRGGGGGAATVITVNGTIVAVAAGGGGGGGGGTAGAVGTSATAATISGIGSGTQGAGLPSVSGPATGGGGGGGFYSGLAGASGDAGKGGQGGVSFGTVIYSGSGAAPGGSSVSVYPGRNVGYASNNGAALLIFNKSFNINVKRSGNWNPVNSAWVKVGGSWRQLLNGWTKVSGVWEPLISADAVVGSENLTTPAITYSLSADSASITEGDSVVFTLATTGIAAGTSIPYTATGIDAVDLSAGTLTGNFTVGTTDTITFTPRENNTTNGTRTIRVSVDNTTASATCTVLDTSLTPVYSLVGNVTTIDEGESVTFTLSTSYVDSGTVIPYSVSGIGAADLSSGSMTGNFIVGTVNTASFTLVSDSLTEGSERLTITLHGVPGSASCAIADTSRAPIPFTGSLTLSGSGSWTVPDYVTSATFTICGGGGGGGGSDGGDKNHNLFGLGGGASDLVTVTRTVSAGQTYSYNIGAGGAGGGGQGAGAGGNPSNITYGASTILSQDGGSGGAARAQGSFSPGRGSSNGGASGGNGSAAGYKNVPGSAGRSGFGTITWTGLQPG